MTIMNPEQLAQAKEKLRLLEAQAAARSTRQGRSTHCDELTLRSLRQLSNQLKEEIARTEAASSFDYELTGPRTLACSVPW